MSLTDLSPAQLRKAADLKERIDALNDELSQLLSEVSGSDSPAPTSGGERVGGGRRTMSATGRAKIAAAARARWAKVRAAKGGSAPAKAVANGAPKKRTMSPAARAKIAAAARARWAKVRAAKGS